jgi:cob(I)alamin adenosyltransferase
MNDEEKHEAGIAHRLVFEQIKNSVSTGEYGMLVMDEMMSCVNCGFLSADDVADFLKDKPENLEVIMTGRNPDEKIAEYADYISEICKIKHPYDKNISARKGIEF